MTKADWPTQKSHLLVLGMAMGFAGLVFALLPPGVVVINDDFGYLKSVVLTIQHGRPWTDDWLEPWAASLSGLAALLYWATGKFHLVIHGLLAVSAGVGFWLCCGLLMRRRFRPMAAGVLAALLLTFPTILWKSVEFTSMALYVPCLLAALWAAESRRWGWFTLVWLLAVTSRQSAIAWLAMPGFELWQAMRQRCFRSAGITAAIGVGGGLFFFGFGLFMNKTHAQAVVTDRTFTALGASSMTQALIAGLIIYLLAAGWGGLAVLWSKPAVQRIHRAWLAVILLAGIGLAVGNIGQIVLREHVAFDAKLDLLQTKVLVVLAVIGWAAGGIRLLWPPAVYALASIALLSLRSNLWDYYLIDIALFGFFGVGSREAIDAGPVRNERGVRLVCGVALAAVGAMQLWTTIQFKFFFDRTCAQTIMAEQAMRANRIEPQEIGFLEFGYRGWYLYPYYVAHEGNATSEMSGFHRYLKWGAVDAVTRYHGWIRHLPGLRSWEGPGPGEVIAAETHPFGWFFSAETILFRRISREQQTGFVPIQKEDFSPWSFPLDDEEWDRFIADGFLKDLAGKEIEYARLSPRQQNLFRIISPKPARFYATFGPALWNEKKPGLEQFSMHPDTRLWFKLPAGPHRLRTTLELAAGAYEGLPDSEATDGVEFVIAAIHPDFRKEILYRRRLDPRGNSRDRGPQAIDWPFTFESKGMELELEINAGPRGNITRDWAVIGRMVID